MHAKVVEFRLDPNLRAKVGNGVAFLRCAHVGAREKVASTWGSVLCTG